MKRITKALTLLLSLCLLLSVSALAASAEPSAEPSGEAAGGLAGTYTDGTSTLVINDDMTFTMNHVGLNLEAEEFVMIITGTVDAAGKFTIDGLFDGEINLIEVATPDQVANDLAKVEAVFAAGKTGAAPAGGLAGTYTDGTSTLTINADMTFSMNKVGQNLEGEDFVMVVTGTVDDAGKFTIDGLYDGEINLIEVATPDQVAADLATVEAVFAAGKADDASADPSAEPSGEAGGVQPGTYTDGTSTLTINADMTFSMNKVGQNLEGEDFVMIVTGTVDAAGSFNIDGLYDDEINLIEVATPDQVAADLATVEAVYAAGK